MHDCVEFINKTDVLSQPKELMAKEATTLKTKIFYISSYLGNSVQKQPPTKQ